MVPSAKIREFLRDESVETPFLVVDLDVVESRYRTLSATLSPAELF